MIDLKQLIDEAIKEASTGTQLNEAVVNVSGGVDPVKFYSAITSNSSGLVFERRGEEYTVKDIDKYIGENLFKELVTKPKSLFARASCQSKDGKTVTIDFYLTRSFDIESEVK